MSSRLLDLCRGEFVGELWDERRAEAGSFGFISSSVKAFVGGVAAVSTLCGLVEPLSGPEEAAN
jgi:hypothetical protein